MTVDRLATSDAILEHLSRCMSEYRKNLDWLNDPANWPNKIDELRIQATHEGNQHITGRNAQGERVKMTTFASRKLTVAEFAAFLDVDEPIVVEPIVVSAHWAPLVSGINNVLCVAIGDKQVVESNLNGISQGLQSLTEKILLGKVEGKPLEQICGENHEQWCEYWFAQGYARGAPGTGRDDAAKTHENLVPYADLSQAQKLKDRAFFLIALAAANDIRARNNVETDPRPFGGAILEE